MEKQKLIKRLKVAYIDSVIKEDLLKVFNYYYTMLLLNFAFNLLLALEMFEKISIDISRVITHQQYGFQYDYEDNRDIAVTVNNMSRQAQKLDIHILSL